MSAALYRIYPNLFRVANTLLDRACQPAGRDQALWFDGEKWVIAPSDGVRFATRPSHFPLAGVYTATANPVDIVTDMLLCVGELEPVA